MIGNYFKIAFRNLTKYKFYSAINIAGLAIGVACSMLIYIFVNHELSYDKFFENSDQIFRIVRHGSLNGTEFHNPVAPAPLASAMVTELPEIEQAVRFRGNGSFTVKRPTSKESIRENSVIFTDSTFFDVFPYTLIEGEATDALARPNTIAISQSAAEKYFPNENALNKTLLLDGKENYEVTAVFENMPENSHMHFDFLLSLSSLKEANNNVWLSNNFYTYVRVKKGVNNKEFVAKLNSFYEAKVEPELQRFAGVGLKEFRSVGNYFYLELQALPTIYLTSDYIFDIGKMGSEQNVYLFISVAIFILGLACINFMNLSTARSGKRAKEVGVRKAVGSSRSDLIGQFLIESIIMSVSAFILAFILVAMVMPMFNLLAERSLDIPIGDIAFVLTAFLGSIVIGFIAGCYPAFYLSSFKPVNTLKGKASTNRGNALLRSSLVVFQFFVSILLIIGTIAIQKQLNFIQNKKIGFKKEHVFLIHDTYVLGESRDAFKEEILSLSSVSSASYSGFIPVNGYNRSDNMLWKKGVSPGESNSASTQMWAVDYDYLKTLGMELIEGRSFDRDRASDSLAVILNEAALKKFDFNENEERLIQTYAFDEKAGIPLPDQFITYNVIGVVEDFHFESMKENIGPLIMMLGNSSSVLSVKLGTDNYESAIEELKTVWQSFNSGLPFNYQFLDDQFDKMYRTEARLGLVFGVFSCLAILIGCLGLFALTTFMAEQRIKEIGIRKVLGANVSSLVLMLTKDFSKLVIIAFLLAAPISSWLLSIWLSEYNYRIEIGWDLFAIAGVIAFTIAWLTVTYQSIRAALSNPTESLKSE